ncbi:MAG TPA: DUF2125 domain-containing protein, partial [Caulobacteraceae bacterium]
MNDPAVRRRPRRSGLAFVVALVLIAIAGWSAWWFYGAARVGSSVDAQIAQLREGGYNIRHEPVRVSGYPFRFKAEVANFSWVDASGVGLQAARLEGAANAYDPRHWVVTAPVGLTYLRGPKGPVAIGGRAIRASVAGEGAIPRIAVELLEPTFTPGVGAQPFPIVSAKSAVLNIRPAQNQA